ncbi:putative GTP-binding protein 6 [Nilaparvata lugens]|uniref:putative GTP-binding protein 6 n=1 Tax=Nilaparvata lugens TaxID=108931 RepID=UPI00193D19C4|nr:putative GTP-binding protein 6 [Nilaparvata lugens]XP_039288432.1 putative GTP-binding protein 6 [Nilaparvata lugens]XP_039288433.1 putative GTP-binding protein 6 [Nilaparvata lugens]
MIFNRSNCLFKQLLMNGLRNRIKQIPQTISYSRLCCEMQALQNHFSSKTFSSYLVIRSPSNSNLRTMSSNRVCDGSDQVNTLDDSKDAVNRFDELFDDLFVEKGIEQKAMGYNIFVIQPYIKWGASKKQLTTPANQLNESVALIDTLKDWAVVGTEIVPLTTTKSPQVFGKGKLEALTKIIKSDESITAVFISLNVLSKVQQDFLEETFGLPVFDRYSVVMRIFREHAVTKEAKLQVAMAEIPQLWRNLSLDKYRARGGDSDGSSGETLYEIRKNIIKEREGRLRAELKSLKKHRDLIRSKRKKRQFPTIAVVGYTNAGKTSLIKALTLEQQMQPKNELFATLDVTCHLGVLPSNIKVLYIDTIGFISDIPTMLIEPFIVTLEDALEADLIVHVIDVSNPDYVAQAAHVDDTLKQLNVDQSLVKNIIVVANKVDLLTKKQLQTLEGNGMLQISCANNSGLSQLRDEVQRILLNVTDRVKIRIRVANGGPEFSWLYKESSVVDVVMDENNGQFIFMDVIVTKTNLERFKFEFIMKKKRERLKSYKD